MSPKDKDSCLKMPPCQCEPVQLTDEQFWTPPSFDGKVWGQVIKELPEDLRESARFVCCPAVFMEITRSTRPGWDKHPDQPKAWKAKSLVDKLPHLLHRIAVERSEHRRLVQAVEAVLVEDLHDSAATAWLREALAMCRAHLEGGR